MGYGTDSTKERKKQSCVIFKLNYFGIIFSQNRLAFNNEKEGRCGKSRQKDEIGRRLKYVQGWRAGLCPCGLGVKSTDLNIPDLNPAVDICASLLCFSATERKRAQTEEIERKRPERNVIETGSRIQIQRFRKAKSQ